MQLGNETALFFTSNRRWLFLSLIWIENYWIWGTYSFSVDWRKRLWSFDTDLLSIKIIRRSITVLWRSYVLNKIILVSRWVHLLLVLDETIVNILLFLTGDVYFMSSTIHWRFQIYVLVVTFVILRVNTSLWLINSIVIFRSVKVLSSMIHYMLRMNYITFSVHFASIEF